MPSEEATAVFAAMINADSVCAICEMPFRWTGYNWHGLCSQDCMDKFNAMTDDENIVLTGKWRLMMERLHLSYSP